MSYRSSIRGFTISVRWPAISARRRRRISSSLLPLNIGPQTTSSQPPRSGTLRITVGESRGGAGYRDSGRQRLRQGRGEALQHPRLVEPPAPVAAAAADRDEVAGARVHRQSRLDRVVAVVPVDQVVDLDEAPACDRRAPAPRERLTVPPA